jgi:hypothetical protein
MEQFDGPAGDVNHVETSVLETLARQEKTYIGGC